MDDGVCLCLPVFNAFVKRSLYALSRVRWDDLDVRWERLFDDLEAQLAAEAGLELTAEVADRTRRERALLGLQDRLAGMRNARAISVDVAGLGSVRARVTDVGADWVLLEPAPDRALLVPFHAIRSMTGLAGRVAPMSAVAKAFTIGAALRAISRDRAVVVVVDRDGVRRSGTFDGVGQDAVDLAEHPTDLPRRPEHVVEVRTIPFLGLAAVQRV